MRPSPPAAMRRSTSGTSSSERVRGDERVGPDPAVGDQPVRLAEALRRVVEGRGHAELLVVEPLGVEGHPARPPDSPRRGSRARPCGPRGSPARPSRRDRPPRSPRRGRSRSGRTPAAAPRGPGRTRRRAPASRLLRAARRRRSGLRPTTTTDAPRSRESAASIRPIAPEPITATVWPSRTRLASIPRTTQASGSTSAASRKAVPGPSARRLRSTIRAGMRANSA